MDCDVAQVSTLLSNLDSATQAASLETFVGSTANTDTCVPPTPDVLASANTSRTSSDSESTTGRKYKPRVVKVEQKGIYTVKTLESVNILREWAKALRTSTPYIIRLLKIFWRLSPTRVSVLITASLSKVVMPSLMILIYKRFLDQVQNAMNGQTMRWRRMIWIIFLGASVQITSHGLDVVS